MSGNLTQVIATADQQAASTQPTASIVKIVDSPSGDPKEGIYRISVPFHAVPMLPEGFTFNQFLLVDEKPLLWHTGMKGLFPAVAAAVASVIPLADLAYIGYAHCEGDECGAMNLLLEAAPNAVPIGSHIEAATYANDAFIRPMLALDDRQQLSLGAMNVQYLWTPHTPHGWGTGFLFESTTKTLFAGDLFTQHGSDPLPVQEAVDIKKINLKWFDMTDYWVWHSKSAIHLERLAALQPTTLLVMHGSSFTGAGCTDMIRQLSQLRAELEAPTAPVAATPATPGTAQLAAA